jgi:predicted nuclease of restriction endonuclease-like (RecB) superfamily
MSMDLAGTFAEPEYAQLLDRVKTRIGKARVRAGLAANKELIVLYWEVGKLIAARQEDEGWGSAVIEHLSRDIRHEFSDLRGFSPRNIWRMRAFYLAYTQEVTKLPQPVAEMDGENLPQLAAEMPWGHNCVLIERIKDLGARLWYMHQTLEHGWSRPILELHIQQGDYERKGKAITNFNRTLPAPQSDLARDVLKDPYIFDFLGLTDNTRERELENALLQNLREFLIELGGGFAFVGNQYRLAIGDDDYYIDLLFYHLKLRCYFVIDLKTRPFAAEDAGKMNFYLNAVDDLLRHPDDQPSVGLVLCREKQGSNRMVLEYALRGLDKPIGVSEYQLTRALPDDLKPSLPTVEEIEREIANTVVENQDSTTGRLVREMRERYGNSATGHTQTP